MRKNIDVFYSNIGQLVRNADGVDIYFAKSNLILSLEFKEIGDKQDFLKGLVETAKGYTSQEIPVNYEEKMDSPIVNTAHPQKAALNPLVQSRLYCSLKALKLHEFGSAQEVEVGFNDQVLYELRDGVVYNMYLSLYIRVYYTELRDILYLDQYNYPLVKITFNDQSCLLYTMEHSQLMRFISEVNSSVLRLRKNLTDNGTEEFQSNIFILQSTPLNRNLKLKGRQNVANVCKDYYQSIIDFFYKHCNDEEVPTPVTRPRWTPSKRCW